ncbi:divergent polysaccharide deacetylase family protein [Desulfatitalea alkaliphila]|uniref:Divergent polysaccharide deacetylase family protein n=1 Tax=Desulfatitalea alkaliphila TaxID=2929485 RepID=A0AA41R5F4_9BACT|nr:divergent polysaccharide deacetylase family protein [Desulfatitalea alkaliphila]MCJ8501176.1 divergent polysaccharide deacetylase family protein [Desulfatitalea alkaliphila]
MSKSSGKSAPRKKRSAAKPAPRKKRPTGKASPAPQLYKAAVVVLVLLALVIAAGVLSRQLLHRPAPPARSAVAPVQRMPVPPPPPSVQPPEKPVYEVFPKTPPPAEPPPVTPRVPRVSPPLVAIIVDDIGYDRPMARRFLDLNIPLTFSVLPYAPFNRTILPAARDKGIEIMLHLPMEPDEYPAVQPGPGALLGSMTPDQLIAQLETNLDQFHHLAGVNNHMGSKLSTSPEHLRQIFSILKKRDLFYIDSRTTAKTVAKPSARLLQLPFAERDIFIDHLDDPGFIQAQMERLIQRAEKQGHAIGIAHPHENTYQVLKSFVPQLREQVTLVSASTVVNHIMAIEAAAEAAQAHGAALPR